MKSKSIFLMAVSLGFGLIAAIGISQVMGRSKAPAEPKVQMVPVAVAADDIDALTELKPEMVKIESWPIDHVPEGAAGSLEDIEGKVIRARLGKDFPIHLKDLVDKTKANRLAIPPGYKVIGIKVSADDHIQGLLQPGDLVDVIGVFRRAGNNIEPISKTFLKKIRVFSVDGDLDSNITRETNKRSTTVVSVLATERQSEELVLVQRIAEVKLVLRAKEKGDEDIDYKNLAENEDPSDTTISKILNRGSVNPGGLRDFFNNLSNEPQSASVPMGEFTMRVISGSGTQIVWFGENGQVKMDGNAQQNQNPSNSSSESDSDSPTEGVDIDGPEGDVESSVSIDGNDLELDDQ